MSDYLTTSELADLIGRKPNQRTSMINWLSDNRWKFVIDRNGIPVRPTALMVQPRKAPGNSYHY